MNVLNIVNIPEKLINELKADYPWLNIRSEARRGNYAEHLGWADIVFGNLPVEMALAAPRLKWLQIVSSGVDGYLQLQNSSVKVTSAKGVHSETIAHHVIMMMLIFSRNFLVHNRLQKDHCWDRKPDEITSLKGKRLGLVGYGSIGQALAPLAKALGMEVTAVKKNPQIDRLSGIEIGEFSKLEHLLATSDHIVICLPFTPETCGIFNSGMFDKVKDGAYLYNVSRGETIDDDALIMALNSGKIRGAALDVFNQEPLPSDHPFWNIENLIITPHVAGHYNGLRESTFELFKLNLSRYLNNEPMRNEVNFGNGY